ncbi:diphosphoinositol polyphosphate phosphohydrolase 1 isoform X3 [Rhinoraja longicauda]
MMDLTLLGAVRLNGFCFFYSNCVNIIPIYNKFTQTALLCLQVLLVSSSRYPDKWIVPGGGMEPDEEPSVAAVREVCEENQDRKHRTYVYVLVITEVLEDWEDSVNIGRKREWFKIDDAIKVLQCHKPVQASYFETFKQGYLANNGTPVVATLSEDKASTYAVANQSSVSSIR